MLLLQLVRDDLILEARIQMYLARRAVAKTNSEDGHEETQMFTEDFTSFTIPSLHFAFAEIKGRLNLFAQLAQALPDSVKKMVTYGRGMDMVCPKITICFALLF